jgi:hypothetical protein
MLLRYIRRSGSLLAILISIVCCVHRGSAQSFTGGFNFALPAIDTSTVASLPSFPKRPIGSGEFVTIGGDGHFSVSGALIRFFGTNCVADGAFPQLGDVWFIAGRLRKMGYNLVRMHHLDNSWTTTGSLFGGMSGTRQINSTNLARLERFLAELKANGIYANINLNVGRTFSKVDGVPDADSLEDMAKGYTYFDPILIALQKEYARQLLKHINPYTGLPLVADPLMAMVEITNENSLYYLWRRNGLKPYSSGGILPVRHQRLLDSLWAEYLRQKYVSETALASSWEDGMAEEGPEQLTNGGYETLPFPGQWSVEQHSPATASLTRIVGGAYEGVLAAKVTVTSSEGTAWYVQWKHTGLSITKDSAIVIRFAARADSARTISFSVMKDVSPYTSYGVGDVKLDTAWQLYTWTITPSASSTNDVRLSFSLGASKGTYSFDAVSVKRAGSAGLLTGETLDHPPRRLDFNECGGFTDGRVRDQTAFYLRLQSDFFAGMRKFLVDTLGVRVPIVGTNWNFGAPDLAVQSGLDYMDNHAYWDHPSFPSTPWSSTDWTITNQPMVTQTDGGTIGSLLGGDAVAGKPCTISEYNHPFPNRYQAEGPLLLTAYAALHSVDGLMFFDYNGGSSWTADMVAGYFDMHRNTTQMAHMPALAFAFRRGLISPAAHTVLLQLTSDDVLLDPKHDTGSWWGISLVSGTLPLIHAVKTETFGATNSNLASVPSAGPAPFVSDTKELRWDPAGVFSVGASRFAAVTGLPQALSGLVAGDLTIMSSSDHSTLSWLSLDDEPLANSRQSLLVLTSRLQNTGMIWDGTTSIHNNWGAAPTLLAPLQTVLRLHVHADSIRVSPLDVLGASGPSARVILPADTNTFTVALDQTIDPTPWYGITAMGGGTPTSVGEADEPPGQTALEQNYPNPFNPTTTIRFTIAGVVAMSGSEGPASNVRLVVYDLLGREVAVLVEGWQPAGRYKLEWDASRYAAGVYFCRLSAGGYTESMRMVLLK